ncbi:Asp23/Gls24 family envelope stress response protein [Streptomyces sp. NPDC091201]|uniref:Asp23/Gls24 family envelope stress response protein n=1 Tax=Streptomyces sp. NPDC091201 TaxID=3155190 RepID=UPI003420F890
MTTARADTATGAVARAVLDVPGVACLRPGLRSLLRAAVPGPAGGRTGGRAREPARSAVHVTLAPDGTVTGIRVEIVVRARHRALDVARAVRAEAARAATAPPAAVRVTVTGVV